MATTCIDLNASNFAPADLPGGRPFILPSAEGDLDGPVELTVVTLPACFDDNQRSATRDPRKIARLEAGRLVNEPWTM